MPSKGIPLSHELRHILSTALTPRFSPSRPMSIARSAKTCSASVPHSKTFHGPSLFSYDSGRFLFNEKARLDERHVEFDVSELQKAAEGAVRHERGPVVGIQKLAEGGFNRVFLLAMQDGFELIAKIPYHIAQPEYYTTASEAATLTFLKLRGVPVPEVYGYCAEAANPVRSEYVLMERAAGVCVASRWSNLTDVEIRRLAHSFVELEKTFFDIPFGATGSVYFKNDIPPNLQAPLYAEEGGEDESNQFCIGPIADYMFWYGRRASLEIDRGPWKDAVDYLQSIARKEITWTQRFGQPMEPKFPYNTLGLGIQHPEDYLRALGDYISLTPHLTPKDPAHRFNRPTLRHPDLTPSNIFIDPNTSRVSHLIDWQHAIVQPQLLAAGYPPAFANPDSDFGPELIEPELPKALSTMPDGERAAALELHRRRLLFFSYRVFNGGLNKPHIAALRDPMLRIRHLLVDYAGRQWAGNDVTLRGAIMRTAQFWEYLPDISGIECPVHWSPVENNKFAEQEEQWIYMSITLELYRAQICHMNEDGWVRNEDFELAKAELHKVEEETWLQCKGDEEDEQAFRTGWPFRDHEEVD